MPKPSKITAVDEFKNRLQSSQIAIATRFIGINADQATDLRRKLRQGNVSLKVFKNTLVRRALDDLELSDAAVCMEGPTAWAFSEDPAGAAKILKEYNKENEKVAMMGGILEGRVVDTTQLMALADLPSREVLLAQVVGTAVAPVRNFVGVLSAPIRDFVNVLEQVRKQKEDQAA